MAVQLPLLQLADGCLFFVQVRLDLIVLAIVAKSIMHGSRSAAFRALEGFFLLLDKNIHAKIANGFQVFYRADTVIAAIAIIKILHFLARKTGVLITILDIFTDSGTAVFLDESTILVAHATPATMGNPLLLGHALGIRQVSHAHATIDATRRDQPDF
jgi:hypothetical protein